MKDQTFISFGLSDIGSTRATNEDVWIALPDLGFFALADGMGGHKAGEIAAQETIDSLVSSFKEMDLSNTMKIIVDIRKAIEKANRHVYRIGTQLPDCQGMGTTLCCLIKTKEAIIYAHVGDSRIYRFRNNRLTLLTQDHSLLSVWLSTGKLAQECTTHYPYKHVITRAIGTQKKANPEIAVASYEEGDLFFLCSDGLSDVLSLSEMEILLQEASTIEHQGHLLVEKAKIKGSSDNMTVVLVQL